MSTLLVTQTRVKPGQEDVFEQALKKMSTALAQYPGFVSQEIHKPNPPAHLDWIIVQKFVSSDVAKAWLQSQDRHTILESVLAALLGNDHAYIVESGTHDHSTVTATITDTINPTNEQKFLHWQLRVAPLQSKFPGFIGYKLERIRTGITESWVSTVTFDTDTHLDAWLKSPERATMLQELRTFTSGSHIEKVYSGFNFWFTNTAQSSRAAWKENMLVLLTLYPVVFLLSYIQNPAMKHGVPFWLALFFSNLTSTVILGYVTVPWLMKMFSWWLKPQEGKDYTIMGAVVVVLLYALLLGICWWLS